MVIQVFSCYPMGTQIRKICPFEAIIPRNLFLSKQIKEPNKMSNQQKIVLVNESRLLRGILKRAIERDAGLHIIAEVDSFAKFPSVIKRAKADWIILALPPGESVPEVVDKVLMEQTNMSLLIMATDGSRVRMRWIEMHESSLDENNLEEILTILREKKGKGTLERINR
jgi:hypothetical protein